MKVVIEKVFPLAATADAAWQCLQNIEAVGGCMPGAKITERVDATHYKGTVTVKIGPAAMSFKGTIEVLELDATQRTLHLVGKGSDSTGTSGASMDLVATVQASGATCELVGKSEVAMSGKAAAFGGRMMNTVADQILKQFVANFAALAQSADAPQAAPSADDPAAAAGTTAQAAAAAPVPARAAELNGLALAWAVVRDWLHGLFSRKTA
ncbi:SRPBCC family protein [Paraburkholderia caffeinilytica]|uniref:SRPBCC family protein n=1 Tax=Paraburkholderia caffeinilytica TaxID=1761016 RepID=UPI0038BC449E